MAINNQLIRPFRLAGFTLIEVAVGLLVLSLLLVAVLSPISTQIDQRKISDTQNTLNQINEALIGYALSKGYLPCPDRTTGAAAPTNPNDTGPNDGSEDLTAGTTCMFNEGNLPWTTLGIPPTDAWGNFYRYRVDANFANHVSPTSITLASQGTLTVKCPATACPPSGTTYATTAPAVVMSHGKNGWGAINGSTKARISTADASADELQNVTHAIAGTFYLRVSTTGGAAAAGTVTPFDDIVVWLSTPVLMGRMVSAQKLP